MVYINKKILKICEDRKWSLYTLAEKTDIPYSTLNSSINRDAPPKIDTLERICEAFGMTLAQFFAEESESFEVLSEVERTLVHGFRKLPEEKQKALIELLDR